MGKWEYLWRETWWQESSRDEGQRGWIRYGHVWKPDRRGEVHPFPDDDGLDSLGEQGWELVTSTPHSTTLQTYFSPTSESFAEYTAVTMIFKRPLP